MSISSGLQNECSVFANIRKNLTIADVFDALTSERCYRVAYQADHAVQIMQEQEKGHFDPRLFEIFLCDVDLFLQIK
ncbi:HD domain-containing phosphohydrolase [Pseudothermotoga sp. U03pept]|uniref:HD domain-containing phosphohydrolase n=1 Tax=Pseudothermotoga sp. U03pept TaxID=3447012 RepID=UPI003F02B421